MVFTLVTLLDDPVAAGLAAEAVEPVATAWDTAARIGLERPADLHARPTGAWPSRPNAHPPGSSDGMQRLVEAVEQGRCPADDFSDRVIENGIAATVTAAGARGAVTSREALVRDLHRARERTLRLVDFDDAELRRQYDPLMSPLVWDLAHIGQQEELWLLRGGDPDRPGMLSGAVENLYDAFVHSRASRADLPLLSPDQARAYCRTVRAAVAGCARRAARRTGAQLRRTGWWSATRTSTTKRCCRH